jgi:hypothetical protein
VVSVSRWDGAAALPVVPAVGTGASGEVSLAQT